MAFNELQYDEVASIAPRAPLIMDPSQGISRRVTVLANVAACVEGEVMGRVTASGKWIKSVRTAVDGSEVPRGIMVSASATSASDRLATVWVFGRFNAARITADASFSATQIREALFDQKLFLEDLV
jgi:hypothetical protein